MSKASNKRHQSDIAHSAESENSKPQVEEPSFASGELGQLQEILFGQQQRSTNQQLGLLQEHLNEQLLAISVELHARMDQLVESLEQSRQHFDKQLDNLKNENKSCLLAVNESVSLTKADLKRDIETISASTNKDAERLSAELAQCESKLLSELSQTKQEFQVEMKGSISSLNNSKLDKETLAQLLGDISGKLSNSAKPRSN